MRHEIAIIGGGIIGSALAFELTRRGKSDVHIYDVDMEGTYSSTERNAGGVRHLWMQPINAELSRLSIAFFESVREDVGFKQDGYLWLYSKKRSANGEAVISVAQSRGLAYTKLSPAEIPPLYPFIDNTSDLAFAIRGLKDGILNSNSLKTFLRKQAKAKGATFHDKVIVTDIQEREKGPTVSALRAPSVEEAHRFLLDPVNCPTATQSWEFDNVIVCAGAWSASLFSRSNAPIVSRPVRRQIAVFSSDEVDLTRYGMIVDTSSVYFHAEGGNILAGCVLKDEPDGFNFSYDTDFFESHIWPALYNRSSRFERLKLSTGWSGLYSYSPDITGILGRVPGFNRVFESHSFTGHGVMHCIGAAIAAAELVLLDRFETIDAAGLSRERFAKGEYLPETLHI